MEGTQGQDANAILPEVKKVIPGAYAIRQLRSGDIDVMVPDQATKDKLLDQPEIQGCKILRQDYPIEIPGVPLNIRVASGKTADNSSLVQDICAAMKRLIPEMAINKIGWLHDTKAQTTRSQRAEQRADKTRGTLIISLPTQALQYQAVQKGVILDSQLFEVRLFDHSLLTKQCFGRNQLGHTQSACGKSERCGECAGPHDTRRCPHERVSCVN